jgi:propionyl-CoA synthetase
MKHIMDINTGDTYFASSDIGWVVGHSFTIYGPLLRGAATILFEGKPFLTNPGALWQIVEKYGVKGLYTSPTALRAIRSA